MKCLKYLIAIPSLIILSIEASSARNSVIHGEATVPDDYPLRFKITREHISHYYQELAQKYPKTPPQHASRINVEKKYNVDIVSPKEAPLLLGLALLEGGTAPTSDKWFVNFYDAYGESGRKLPKDGYAADCRADLVIGLHHQWPEFIFAMKVRKAVEKQAKDGIKHKPFADGLRVRVRPSVENLNDEFYFAQSSDKSLKFAIVSETLIQPMFTALTTRAFAARKQLWQAKRSLVLNPMQARAH